MKNIKFNNFTKKTTQNISKQSAYENIKAVYEGYVKKIENTDFANSFTRYEIELKMLKSMKEMAEKVNNIAELKYIEEKISKVADKLEEYGVEIEKL